MRGNALRGAVRVQESFGFLPFGAGARTCVGRHLAMAELVALAAELVSGLEMEPLAGDDVASLQPVGGITLAPPVGGLPIRVSLRSDAALAA